MQVCTMRTGPSQDGMSTQVHIHLVNASVLLHSLRLDGYM